MDKICSRCGGTGKVTRGRVINGVCYKCGGDGQHRPAVYADRRSVMVQQYVLVNDRGQHLAINTDKAVLQFLAVTLGGKIEIL